MQFDEKSCLKSEQNSVRLVNFTIRIETPLESPSKDKFDVSAANVTHSKSTRMLLTPGISFETRENASMLDENKSLAADEPKRLDRFYPGFLKRSKSLEVVDHSREELLHELQFPISPLYSRPHRFKSIKNSINYRLNRSRSQTEKSVDYRREFGEIAFLKKIKQYKGSLKIYK